MDQAGPGKRQRALRHAAPERVRELLSAYRRRAARDVPPARRSTRTGEGSAYSSRSRATSAGSSPPSGTVSSAG
jgi:hypothetical protein